MKRLASLTLFLTLLLIAHLSNAAVVPSFSSDGLTFDVYTLETETKLVFFDPKWLEDSGSSKKRKGPEYSVETKGAIRKEGPGPDVIAFTEDLVPARATSDQGASILVSEKSSSKSAWEGKFRAMKDYGAEVELKDAKLTSNPYRLKDLVVMGQALIAQQRETKTLDAIVEEDKVPVVAGISLRLSSMKISNRREVDLDIEYRRREGLGAPVLEAVYAIDSQGNTLGGGVWDKAESIFASEIKFKSKFTIPSRAKIDKLKLVFVTVYEMKPYAFIVDGVFQR